MMNRLQGYTWKEYITKYPERSLNKFIFSIGGNIRVESKNYYHWCNDLEKKIVFMFIRNNKELFRKEDRTYYPIKKHTIKINEIFLK